MARNLPPLNSLRAFEAAARHLSFTKAAEELHVTPAAISHQIKALEEAGAYAVEVEVIPEELLTEISKRTSLMTSSIGAGSGGDIQFLFAEDILGNNPPPYPRHSKQYRELYKMREAMQRERIAGFREFVEDVRAKKFPAKEHIIKTPTNLMEDFLSKV